MIKSEYSSANYFTLIEASHILNRSLEDVKYLINSGRLGFIVGESNLLVSNQHIADFFLGKRPICQQDYVKEGPKRKSRKHYVKARTRR